MKNREIEKNINNQRTQNSEIIILSIVVSLGINLLATGIMSFFNLEHNANILIIIGIILSCAVILIYMFFKIKDLNNIIKIDSCFIFDRNKKRILRIPNFESSHDMSKYLNALLMEDKKINKKLSQCKYLTDESYRNITIDDNDYFKKLINDLIEFIILDNISLVYIDNYRGKVSLYEVESIKDIKDNPFIKTLTKDIKKREAFKRKDVESVQIICENDQINKKQLVSSETIDGYIYQRMDMEFPKGTKIFKTYKNQLIIDTKYYKLIFTWDFRGFGKSVDNDFYKFFFNREKNWDTDDEFYYNIKIETIFKGKLIFNKNRYKEYQVLDELINRFTNRFDYDKFLENIDWKLTKNLINYNSRKK